MNSINETKARIAVFGASGFVGTAVVERLLCNQNVKVVAIIHSDGSAWRLFRRKDLLMRQIDILSAQQVGDVLEGVTHVVNCTRGSEDVMIKGLGILLAKAGEAKIKQFVHLSSLLIYGERPPPESAHESASPNPQGNIYGTLKLKQDVLVQKAVAKGLPATILCPPNIIGPYSYFLNGLVKMIASDQFGLVTGSDIACSTVDVENLAVAIELALFQGTGEGKRYFVTDNHDTTWEELVSYILPLTGKSEAIRVEKRQIQSHLIVPNTSLNPLKSLRHLVSSDVREVLRKDPLLSILDLFFRKLVARLPGKYEDQIRLSVEGPIKVAKVTGGPDINWQFCSAQLRGVFHSCSLLENNLGYSPKYSFEDSMKAYVRWQNTMRGNNTKFGSLLNRLN